MNQKKNKLSLFWKLTFVTVLAMMCALLVPQRALAVSIDHNATEYYIGTKEAYSISGNGSKWYTFNLEESSILLVESSFEMAQTGFSFDIYDSEGNHMEGLSYSDNNNKKTYCGLIKGKYYIYICGTTPDVKKKNASFKITRVDGENNFQTFIEDYSHADTRNDSRIDAVKISAGKTYHGIIGINNSIDWYKLVLNGKAKIELSQKDYRGESSEIRVYDDNNNEIARQFNSGATTSTELSEGTYYIKATRYDYQNSREGVTAYTITIGKAVKNINTIAKKLIKNKPDLTAKKGGKLTIKWNLLSGVKGYQVQVSTNKKFTSSKKVYTITGKVNKKVITLPITMRNKNVYVRIRAYKTSEGKKVYSNWSKVGTIKTRR